MRLQQWVVSYSSYSRISNRFIQSHVSVEAYQDYQAEQCAEYHLKSRLRSIRCRAWQVKPVVKNEIKVYGAS